MKRIVFGILLLGISGLWLGLLPGMPFQSLAFAQDVTGELITQKLEGTAKSDLAITASREIQANLTADFAREQIIQIIGEKRYLKNKLVIDTKIIREAAKFIPFVNPGPIAKQPDGLWKMAIEFRLSQSSLRKMILNAGLMNDNEGPASILPLVTFSDKEKSTATHWWMGEEKDETHKFLAQISHEFYEKLQTEFSRQGFHLIKPQGTEVSPFPEAYRVERPSAADFAFMTDYFGATMILKGEVSFRESKTLTGTARGSVQLQVMQPNTGRVIAEVSREFETGTGAYEPMIRSEMTTEDPEIGKELATQVFEAWQKGTLNTNLIRLGVRGHLTPQQLTAFKNDFARAMHDVKGLKERLFEPGEVFFDVDYAGDASQLADKLRGLTLAGFQVRLADSSDKSLALEVKAK